MTTLTLAQHVAVAHYTTQGIPGLIRFHAQNFGVGNDSSITEVATWAQDTLEPDDWAVFNGAHTALMEWRAMTREDRKPLTVPRARVMSSARQMESIAREVLEADGANLSEASTALLKMLAREAYALGLLAGQG